MSECKHWACNLKIILVMVAVKLYVQIVSKNKVIVDVIIKIIVVRYEIKN